MSYAPSTILRRASTDRIAAQLKRGRLGLPVAKGGEFEEPPLPGPEPTPIPGVGQFDTPGYLPTGPGPADPTDLWTRSDPNMGQLPPSVTIDPSQGSGLFPGEGSGATPSNLGGLIGTNAAGPFPGGNMGGPQGSVYGINPVTGNTIYNVTGSPRPGFFDSRTGRVAATLGSAALNVFVPGLGYVSRAIFDAYRRNQAANNTGTDLSGRQRPGGGQPRTSGSGSGTWTAGTGTPIINVATGQQELNRSGAGHNDAAHSAMLYNMSQSYAPTMPRPAVADFRGYMDAEGVQHNQRRATPAQIMAAFQRGSHPYQNPTNLATNVTAAQIQAMRRPRSG